MPCFFWSLHTVIFTIGLPSISVRHMVQLLKISLKMKVKVTQSCPALCDPMDYTVHGILQVRILEWVVFPFSGIEPRSSALLVDSLSAEVQGKPKNTGIGSLSLLQRIFPTQGSNRSLLHCRQILYQLSYLLHSHIYIFLLLILGMQYLCAMK